MDSDLLVAVVGASSLLLGGGLSAMFVRRKTTAEAHSLEASATGVITDAAARLVTNLEKDYARRLTDIEAQLRESQAREHQCITRMAQLEVQVVALTAALAAFATSSTTTTAPVVVAPVPTVPMVTETVTHTTCTTKDHLP